MHRLLPLCVSIFLLVMLYRVINFSVLWKAMQMADSALLTIAMGAIVPLMLATAWRFSLLVGAARISILTSIELILMGNALNVFLPFKSGDFAKAAVLVDRYGMDAKLALSICLLEKVLDLATLALLGGTAILYVAG